MSQMFEIELRGRTETLNPETIFEGKLKEVDDEVKEFLIWGGDGGDEGGGLTFKEPFSFFADFVPALPVEGFIDLDPRKVMGILLCLDDNLGNNDSSLIIPDKEDEINLVLGRIEVDDVSYVLYLEHENEPDKNGEEYHLHVRKEKRYRIASKANRLYLKDMTS